MLRDRETNLEHLHEADAEVDIGHVTQDERGGEEQTEREDRS
jgi:hypothetical protein